MMLCLFSQTSRQNKTKPQILFFCITCFCHLAMITCSTRLKWFWMNFGLFSLQKVKVNSRLTIQEIAISKVSVTNNLNPISWKNAAPQEQNPSSSSPRAPPRWEILLLFSSSCTSNLARPILPSRRLVLRLLPANRKLTRERIPAFDWIQAWW